MTIPRPIDTGAGDTIFWIAATVILTLIFTVRGNIRMLMNPIYAMPFIVALIFSYIVITAISVNYGFGDWINMQILNVQGWLP